MKSTDRKKQLGEVFTPPQLVNEMLDQLPSDQFTTPTKLFLDPTCGNGNFLVEVLKRKLPHTTRKQALLTTFGADLMFDNCVETILRLYYDFPFYNTNNTINDAARQALDEESCKVKNNTSDYVEILDLTTIVETHFQYYNSPQITNSLFAPKAVSPDTARLAKHTANLTSMQYATPRTQDGKSHTLLEFLRPGLLALFICKKTVNGVINKGQIFPTIVQADGLVYDYSFGECELTDKELQAIRLSNKPREVKTCPLTGEKNITKAKPRGDYAVVETRTLKYKIANQVVDMLQKDKSLFTPEFKEEWIEQITNSSDVLQICKSDLNEPI